MHISLLTSCMAKQFLEKSEVFGPWWWFGGQSPRFLLSRSEFKSCWLLNLYEKMKINEKEAGVGPFKKSEVLHVHEGSD